MPLHIEIRRLGNILRSIMNITLFGLQTMSKFGFPQRFDYWRPLSVVP